VFLLAVLASSADSCAKHPLLDLHFWVYWLIRWPTFRNPSSAIRPDLRAGCIKQWLANPGTHTSFLNLRDNLHTYPLIHECLARQTLHQACGDVIVNLGVVGIQTQGNAARNPNVAGPSGVRLHGVNKLLTLEQHKAFVM